MSDPMAFPLGVPDDGPRWLATVGAGIALWILPRLIQRPPRALREGAQRGLWLAAPIAAAALSALYVVHYLRGGPRIIDATAYYLQARALSEGFFAFPLPEPEQAVLGRFLVRTTVDGAPAAAVIFPPGYPAVLALGFLVGAPMAIGPLLAAALTWATMALARATAEHLCPERAPAVVLGAAWLAVFSAALRYHTADTMSHGLAALAVTIAAWCALRWLRAERRLRWAAGAGLALGVLFATRPASALAIAPLVGAGFALAPVVPWRDRVASAAIALAASAPALALWLGHQHAATGSFTTTAQSLYYALGDGPPGCFRYGFGAGIGCRGEHGTFVADNLADGYGLVAALKTSARRLALHLSDALGFAPAFAAVVVGAVHALRARQTRLLALAVPALWLAYAPFYFDGNYPGGGARLFADVLPIEIVLAAIAAARLRRFEWGLAALAALQLFGFALYGGRQHRHLAEREGGRPMFEASVLEGDEALVFVDTDHGFDLAYDPANPRFARYHGDGLDELLWEARGRPVAFRYRHDFGGGAPGLEELELEPSDWLRIEGESLWPPLAQVDGWVWPSHAPDACASRGKVLWLEPTGSAAAATLRLPDALAGSRLRAMLFLPVGSQAIVTLRAEGVVLGHRTAEARDLAGCTSLPPIDLPAEARDLSVELSARGPVGLDVVELRRDENR